jgi:phytoene synthase
VRAHPVADAFLDTIAKSGLPHVDFTALIEARRFDLYDDPMPDVAALIAYCDATASCLFRAAAQIVSAEQAKEAAHAAGIAYALTGVLRALPMHASRGRCFVPADLLAKHGASAAEVTRQDTPELRGALADICVIAGAHLAQAQDAIRSFAPSLGAAFLPLALVPAYLNALRKRDYNPFTAIEVPQWRRQWRLWRASRSAGVSS